MVLQQENELATIRRRLSGACVPALKLPPGINAGDAAKHSDIPSLSLRQALNVVGFIYGHVFPSRHSVWTYRFCEMEVDYYIVFFTWHVRTFPSIHVFPGH